MKLPDVAQVIVMENYTMLFTSVDYSELKGTVIFFDNIERAEEYIHKGSLDQFPEWHKTSCLICKLARGGGE